MAETPTRDGQSAIYDIGFRHYDGPRRRAGAIGRSLVVETFRGVWGLGRPARFKVMPWLMLSSISIPAIVIDAVLVVGGGAAQPPRYASYPISVWILTALFVAVRAPYAVSRDVRYGTIPLYLTRPMTRGGYAAGRLAGVALGVFSFLAVPELALLVGALLAKLQPVDQLRGWLGGLAVCAMLALVTSALGVAIASATPRRGLGVAMVAVAFIVINAVASNAAYAVGVAWGDQAENFAAGLDPFVVVNGIAVRLLGVPGQLPAPHGFFAAAAFVAWFAVLVAGSFALLLRRVRRIGGVVT